MKLNWLHFCIGFAILLILAVFFKPFFELMYVIVKTTFEGSSAARTYFVLGFEAIFFGIIWHQSKQKKTQKKSFFFKFIACGIIAFALNVFLNSLIIASNSNSNELIKQIDLAKNGIIGKMIVVENERVEWEASRLRHLHTNKIALAPLNFLPIHLPADLGKPLSMLVPYSIVFSILLLIILGFAVYYFFQEAISKSTQKPSIEIVIFSIAGFGFLETMIDGGFMGVGGHVSIGLMFYYYLRTYLNEQKKIKPTQLFFFPIFFVAGLFLMLSLVFGGSVAPNFGLVFFAIIIALTIIIENRKNKKIMLIGSLLIMALLFSMNETLLSFWQGEVLEKGKENTIFIYGLDKKIGDGELKKYFEEKFGEMKFERTHWIAFMKGKPKNTTTTREIEKELRERLKPNSYLYVLYTINEGKTVINTNKEYAEMIKGIKSEFVEIKEKEIKEEKKIIMTSPLTSIYANLYLLNYLHFEKGIKNPVIITR